MRVALYARVSTEEQARTGLSIDTQLDNLREWAIQNEHDVVGEYVDAGISGKKPPSKRPELSRFFDDIENGMKVDVLVFTKLDRFFRSVKLYYQAVDLLERHKIAWKAIQEDYETLTASGRMKVNIMLSVAENEADRTSERIKVVFDRKIANGECVNPNGLPLGYKCENKRVVPDENAPAARAVFEHYARHGNKMGARSHLQTEWGIDLPVLSIDHMLHNPLYKGEYRGNLKYCEPIVDAELFDSVQDDLARRSTRHTPSGRIYLFTGLIICRECGRRMCSGTRYSGKNKIPYYRCPEHYMMKRCENRKCPREYQIESALIDTLESELANQEYEYTLQQKNKPPKNKVDKKAIEQKMERLKNLYVNGFIDIEQYKEDHKKFAAILQEPEPERIPKFETARKIIGNNFRANYESFERAEKKTFWRSVLDHIEMDSTGELFVFFR